MKIGFDAKRAYTNATGLGNFSRCTILGLARQYPDAWFYLFHPGKKRLSFNDPENTSEVEPVRVWWKTFSKVWRSFRIARLAKELQLDIYHGLSHELPFGIEKSGAKSIVTIHDLIFLRFPKFHKKIDREIYERKIRHSCRVATRVHAISEQTKLDLIELLGVPNDKIEVIYQSVNPLFYSECSAEQKSAIRQKFQLPEQFLLNVGTIESRKNLVALLEGMVHSNIRIPLFVVGKPTDYKQKAMEFIQSNANDLQVTFLSGIQDSELTALYQMAEMMIYPSLYEGFGLPVAEAQACGCPVITSNISSLPEAGGDGALYVNPEKPEKIGKAIESLLTDKSLREVMILKGKMNAQRFTLENFIKQLNQLYNSVLND